MKSRNDVRRSVATTLRVSVLARPVERTRNVPVPRLSIVEDAAPETHDVPVAGISSSVYLLLASDTLRHTRGSGPVPAQRWLTGLASVGLGAGTLVQRVQ
jgi:hypothetical protein